MAKSTLRRGTLSTGLTRLTFGTYLGSCLVLGEATIRSGACLMLFAIEGGYRSDERRGSEVKSKRQRTLQQLKRTISVRHVLLGNNKVGTVLRFTEKTSLL